MKQFSSCQSCGMPLKKDPNLGGSNADGTKSSLYCSLCFDKGEFLQPDITANEMQGFVKGKLQEMGLPRFLAWLFSTNIPKLQRWRKGKK